MEFPVNRRLLVLLEGDITKVPVDAVVNAANSQLIGGGGVDGAIHRAGGPSIMAELDAMRPKIGACATGKAVVTTAGLLPAKHVIHAVGPIYRDGRQAEPQLLASCYQTSLELAAERGAASISFPSISTGVYGYPIADAADIALRTVIDFLNGPPHSVEKVIFVLFGQSSYAVHAEVAERLLGNPPQRTPR